MERGLQKVVETSMLLKKDLNRNSHILDFGCGDGELVYDLRKYGFIAFGCDFEFKSGHYVEELANKQFIRKIKQDPYLLPFEDNCFDLVFSTEVFEHIRDYSSALGEIHRVLKPGGASLHIFPSRYRFIESHVFVPFASILRQYWWLLFWAKLGIRNHYQDQMSAQEVADNNYHYLHQDTTYYSKKDIKKFVYQYFDNCQFCEREAAKYSRLGKYYHFIQYIPFFSNILSTFQTRVIYFQKSANHLIKSA